MANDTQCTILNWNVKGLNNPARCQVLKDLIAKNNCSIVCIQESKLQIVDDLIISSTLGQQFLGQYVVLLAEGASGGIILACSHEFYSLSQIVTRRFSVTAYITNKRDNESWSMTAVYGPQGEADKMCFMQEPRDITQTTQDRWLLLGDFNLIYMPIDKNSGHIN
jgi:exonuclease III